ncbi:hypothetical protein [Nocardia cyriacigeorgica]|uniref:hypothetical protein n=1 Tax=Nocardia cyriacigeorgica TaxID=135487 RepID=UPI002456EA42|nr:hypothetical protein [Nocardia cyriacigeorgica]
MTTRLRSHGPLLLAIRKAQGAFRIRAEAPRADGIWTNCRPTIRPKVSTTSAKSARPAGWTNRDAAAVVGETVWYHRAFARPGWIQAGEAY